MQKKPNNFQYHLEQVITRFHWLLQQVGVDNVRTSHQLATKCHDIRTKTSKFQIFTTTFSPTATRYGMKQKSLFITMAEHEYCQSIGMSVTHVEVLSIVAKHRYVHFFYFMIYRMYGLLPLALKFSTKNKIMFLLFGFFVFNFVFNKFKHKDMIPQINRYEGQ